MAQVLLVEDDSAIRTALTRGLTDLGHVMNPVASGVAAIAELGTARPDVVVLDLGLPDMDGANVLAVTRAMHDDLPVIVATARDDERDIIRLLDAGADDYLVKPFSAAQMDARIRAVLRRLGTGPVDSGLSVGGLRLDQVGRTVTLDGRQIELTRKEFDLLALLMQHPGEVISKSRLLAEVWHMPWGGGDRTVDVHLSWLRRKLGETAATPRYLISVRGVGVKLVDPEEPR
ncbi:response regulator transcription factor [Gordonia sp. NPDC003504]